MMVDTDEDTDGDTDGDGIGDYEETYSTQTVGATKSPDDSKAFLGALYGGDDPGVHLDTDDDIQTDPYLADTDLDGIPDGREIEYGTNPEKRDTDGDSIGDAEELDEGTDPTIHDFRGPDVDVREANAERYYELPDEAGTAYSIAYRVVEPGGVIRTEAEKNSETKAVKNWPSRPTSTTHEFNFKTGVLETTGTFLAGAEISINATDRHGNHRETVALQRRNFAGQLAAELDGEMTHPDIARDIGAVSGFASGAGETVNMVDAVLDDPVGYLTAIAHIVEIVDKLGLLEDLIRLLPNIDQKQDRNNPYDLETERALYQNYQFGWYAGYIAYLVVSTIYGGSAAKVVKSSKYVGELAKLPKSQIGKSARALKASRTTKAVTNTNYRLSSRIGKNEWAIETPSARTILSGAKTAAQMYVISQRLLEEDSATLANLDSLDEADQRTIGRGYGRAGEPIADGGGDLLELFREAEDVDPQTVQRLEKLKKSGDLSNNDVDVLVRAHGDGTIDGNDLRRISKLVNGSNERYLGDDALSVDQILEVEEQGGDLSRVKLVVEDEDDNVRWLELGSPEEGGWLHITGRHILGTSDLQRTGKTSFFPVGQTVKGRTLPETMNVTELQVLIQDAVKNADDVSKYNDKYYFEPTNNGYPYSGVDKMRVLVDSDGAIETAFPIEGGAVRKWRPDLRDGDGGWEDIHDD